MCCYIVGCNAAPMKASFWFAWFYTREIVQACLIKPCIQFCSLVLIQNAPHSVVPRFLSSNYCTVNLIGFTMSSMLHALFNDNLTNDVCVVFIDELCKTPNPTKSTTVPATFSSLTCKCNNMFDS